jgi:hypothetical protein
LVAEDLFSGEPVLLIILSPNNDAIKVSSDHLSNITQPHINLDLSEGLNENYALDRTNQDPILESFVILLCEIRKIVSKDNCFALELSILS